MAITLLATASVVVSAVVPASAIVPPLTAQAACEHWEVGTPDVSVALENAVCWDLVNDLDGIGPKLGLPVITPTLAPQTDQVKVIFSKDSAASSSTLMQTTYFAGLVTNAEQNKGFAHQPCQITIFPAAYLPESPVGIGVSSRLHVLLAHEAVHCYQNTVFTEAESGDVGNNLLPAFMSEGSATYLATSYVDYGEQGTPSFWKAGWFGLPNKNVSTRGYDAVGWYSLIAKTTGNDLWSKMVPAWRAYQTGGASAFIQAIGGNDDATFRAWAPSLLHQPSWGDLWNSVGIGLPSDAQPAMLTDTLNPGDASNRVTVQPYGAIVDSESIANGNIVELSTTKGYVSVHDASGRSYPDFSDQLFCLKTSCNDSAVTCAGSTAPIPLQPLTSPFVVAVGGSADTATYEITRIDPPKTPTTPLQVPASAGPCNPDKPAGAPAASYSEGDPHLQTLNGGQYDFQGAGEYTLVKSQSGDVDVQVRAGPAAGSDAATWNTAVAMRVVSSTVEVDVGTPATVLVNGKTITPPKSGPLALAGGGRLTYSAESDGDDVVVSWPDGSKNDVFADARGANSTFTPPVAGVDQFSGLLAALTSSTTVSSTTEQLRGGDGKFYSVSPATDIGFATLYGAFAKSWKVTKATSLFTYPAGKGVGSYDIKGFPTQLATSADLTPAERAKAEATCKNAGVTTPALLTDCELDVATTGNVGEAAETAQLQKVVATAIKPPVTVATVHPITYYFTNPCSVVTAGEIAAALGSALSDNVGAEGACVIGAQPVDAVDFSHVPETLFKLVTPGKAGSGPVNTLGHSAYCIVGPSIFPTQSYVVATLGSSESIEVLAANCTQAGVLMKDALGHISGI